MATMFVIRKSQFEAFSRAALEEFEERMVIHLRKVFPDTRAATSRDELRETIREAIGRAGHWGLERKYDVCLYLHVVIALGSHFEDNPRLAWTQALLEDEQETPSARIETLHERVFPDEAPEEGFRGH